MSPARCGQTSQLDSLSLGTPAEALLASEPLRCATSALLKLRRGDGGEAEVDSLLDRVVAQLRAGRIDWGQLTGDEGVWSATGLAISDVEDVMRSTARLLSVGNNQASEVAVVSGRGLDFEGVWSQGDGAHARFSFRRSAASAQWGQWTSYYVADGPSALVGLRLVASQRDSGSTTFGPSGELVVEPGDKLYVATADRAAVLDLATFDQLPEASEVLARLTRPAREGSDDHAELVDVSSIAAPPELWEAARFANRLDALQTDAERTRARLDRLQGFQVSEDLLRRARADALWREVLDALEPRKEELYDATRAAMLRVRPSPKIEPRKTVAVVQVNLLSLLAALVLVTVLGFGAAQFFGKQDLTGGEELPLYTLGGTENRKVVPILSGTPLMPSAP